jgi:cellulose synthase operon protein C
MGQPWDTTTTALRIGDLSVNLRQRRVEIDGCIAELPPRVFDLFLLFLAEPGVVHSRESLFRRIWPGLVVEDGSLSQGIWLLRRALGEERKHCLRTVSRLGYVFEPWTRIVPETDPDESVAADVAAPSLVALESASSSSISPSVSRSKTGSLFGRRRITLAAALLAVAAIASVLWAVRPWSDAAADAPPATVPVASVGVVLLAPTVSDPDALKAGVLLRDWVRFRLWGFPEVLVLSEEDLGDDASYAPDHVILLTTGRVAGEAGQVFLRATFGASGAQGGEHRIERRGTPGQLPKMIEAVAAEVVTRIAPQRRSAPAPSYAIGDSAADYAEGLRKIEARDWPGAVVALQAAMRSAPRAGIVRLRLAEVLAEQSESRLASEQLVAARSMFGPLPVDTEALIELLRDRSLATADADFLRIAARYDALAKRHPERIDYALDAIRLQVSAGRLQDALRSLSQPEWDRQPFRIRITAGLLRCKAQVDLGHFDAGERCAQAQIRLAGGAGATALWYLGRAESLLAVARYNRNPDRVDLALFEQAARTLDAGGNAIDALRERARAKLLAAGPGADAMPELEQTLADVRRNGLRDLEVLLLCDLARRSLALGRNADYRRLLTDAERAAAIAGDETRLTQLSLELLIDDLRLGAIDDVELRIAALQRMPLGGEDAMTLAVMTSNLRLGQGRSRESRAALLRGTIAVTDDGRLPPSPLAAGMLGYARAHVAMNEGRLDEAAEALAAARRGMPEYYAMILDLSDASLAIMRGDTERTKSRIERGLGALQGVDDAQTQRQAKINAAFLLTRVGEAARAARMYEDVLPGVTEAGDVYLRTHVLTGLAEAAAAQRDWSASRRHADAAAATAVGRQWVLSSRLSLLRLAEALDRGHHAQARERFAQLDAGAVRADDHLVRSALALLRDRFPAQHRPELLSRPGEAPLYRSEAAWLADAVRMSVAAATVVE